MDQNLLAEVAGNLNKGLPSTIQEYGLGVLIVIILPLSLAAVITLNLIGAGLLSVETGILLVLSSFMALAMIYAKGLLIGGYVKSWEESSFNIAMIIRLIKDESFRKNRIALFKREYEVMQKESDVRIYSKFIETLYNSMVFPNLGVYGLMYLITSAVFYTSIVTALLSIFTGKLVTIDYQGVPWLFFVFLGVFSSIPLLLLGLSLWIDFFYVIQQKLKGTMITPCCVEVKTEDDTIYGFVETESKEVVKVVVYDDYNSLDIPWELRGHRTEHEIPRSKIKKFVRHYLKEKSSLKRIPEGKVYTN